jgi:hypothetical protein
VTAVLPEGFEPRPVGFCYHCGYISCADEPAGYLIPGFIHPRNPALLARMGAYHALSDAFDNQPRANMHPLMKARVRAELEDLIHLYCTV